MKKILMNKDIPVLSFYYKEDKSILFDITVLNNDFLPYELKDYVINSSDCDTEEMIYQNAVLSDYLSSRTLNLSRDNAKAILNVAVLPQSIKTADKLRIVTACRGLTMTDSFWLKDEGEDLSFSDVNLRTHPLSEASYKIAILGQNISATRKELVPDLSTDGMFPKYWKRDIDSQKEQPLKKVSPSVNQIDSQQVYLYKTDKFTGNPNSKSEIECSRILTEAGADVVHYFSSVCKCIATDEYSLIPMQSIRDYLNNVKIPFYDYVKEHFLKEFSNMCVCDYVVANTDRHFSNFGVMVSTDTNQIERFAPLYDHNQALIADTFHTDINDLIYEPTGKTFYESIKEWAVYANVDFSKVTMSKECQDRWQEVQRVRAEEKIIEEEEYER